MDVEEIRIYCLSKHGATEDSAFGDTTVLFRLCGKIFACIDLKRPNLVVLKNTEERSEDLRQHFSGICGAWHWNKKYWNDVFFDADVDKTLVMQLIDESYEIIRTGLPQRTLFNFKKIPEGWVHEHFDVVDSTMNVLRSESAKPLKTSFLLVTADYQTAGRGQGTNTWESASGKNLLMAFRFSPSVVKAADQFLLLQCISVSIAEALEKFYKKTVKIKWPNDIYCEDKKICGILIEHDLCGEYITSTRCGIGINVNQDKFTSPAPNPVSLKQLVGKEVDRAALLGQFLECYMHNYHQLLQGERGPILLNYFKRLYRLGGWYPYRDCQGDFIGKIYAVMDDGRLQLIDHNGKIRTYAHKEVEYILTKKEEEPSLDDLIKEEFS